MNDKQKLDNLFTETANAIREKTGEQGKIKPKDFPNIIKTMRGTEDINFEYDNFIAYGTEQPDASKYKYWLNVPTTPKESPLFWNYGNYQVQNTFKYEDIKYFECGFDDVKLYKGYFDQEEHNKELSWRGYTYFLPYTDDKDFVYNKVHSSLYIGTKFNQDGHNLIGIYSDMELVVNLSDVLHHEHGDSPEYRIEDVDYEESLNKVYMFGYDYATKSEGLYVFVVEYDLNTSTSKIIYENHTANTENFNPICIEVDENENIYLLHQHYNRFSFGYTTYLMILKKQDTGEYEESEQTVDYHKTIEKVHYKYKYTTQSGEKHTLIFGNVILIVKNKEEETTIETFIDSNSANLSNMYLDLTKGEEQPHIYFACGFRDDELQEMIIDRENSSISFSKTGKYLPVDSWSINNNNNRITEIDFENEIAYVPSCIFYANNTSNITNNTTINYNTYFIKDSYSYSSDNVFYFPNEFKTNEKFYIVKLPFIKEKALEKTETVEISNISSENNVLLNFGGRNTWEYYLMNINSKSDFKLPLQSDNNVVYKKTIYNIKESKYGEWQDLEPQRQDM